MLCCHSNRNRQMESASELVRIIFMRGRQKTQRICLPLFAKNNDWHSHHHEAWSLFGIHYSSSGSSISQKSHRMNTQITILLFEYSNYIITTWLLPNVQGVRVTFHLFQKAITSSKIDLEQKFLLVSANHGRPFHLR